MRVVNDGITVKTRPLSAWRAGDGAPVETTTMLTHTTFEVAASRERALGLVGDPTRGAEWDPLDRGHECITAFDDDHPLMRTLSKPPAPWQMRESLLLTVVHRSTMGDEPWVHCARAVTSPSCPTGTLPRALQQVFGWDVLALGPNRARLTALSTVPENLLPIWLLNLASPRGWLGLARKVRRIVEARD